MEDNNLIPLNRVETLTLCNEITQKWESARKVMYDHLVKKIREDHEKKTKRLPKFLHFLIKTPNPYRWRYEIPVNRAGWCLEEYLEAHFEIPIEILPTLITLCKRSDGENIYVSIEQFEDLQDLKSAEPLAPKS